MQQAKDKPVRELSSRSRTLARIRRSLDSRPLPPAHISVDRHASLLELDRGLLIRDFIRELGAAGVVVEEPATPARAVGLVVEMLRDALAREPGASPGKEILAWHDSELPLTGLGEAVRTAGFVPLSGTVPAGRKLRCARLAELGSASAGLTGALGGLADTGTLALLSGPNRPRLASLLPPVHIAIVSKSAVYPTMAAFFAAHPQAVEQASNLVFITGPSRTADIEQALTLGVHGPRELYVVLVD